MLSSAPYLGIFPIQYASIHSRDICLMLSAKFGQNACNHRFIEKELASRKANDYNKTQPEFFDYGSLEKIGE